MTGFPSPLPLEAFEEYMLRDDRPKYPMNIFARLRFSGRIDQEAASRALGRVVARHPLLRSKVEKSAAGRLVWVTQEGQPPAIEWFDGPTGDRMPAAQPMDLFSGPALRAWATTDKAHSSLAIQVHHAACDGKAVFEVLDEFLRVYASEVAGGPPAALPPCDAEAFRRRGTFGLTWGKSLRILPAQLSALPAVGEFLFRQPTPLLDAARSPAGRGNSVKDSLAVKFGRLGREELQALTAAAAARGVTVNDWLVRDFFVAVNDFRRQHGAVRKGDWIRFSVPINLRRPGTRISAANAVSMLFLDRTPGQIDHHASLLRSVHEQMVMMRRRQWGLTFIWSLWALRMLPGGIVRRVDSGRCEVTCVLSNLGRAMADSPLPRREGKIVAGNLVLDDIDFFTPVRDGTAVTMALVFYGGRLQLRMQYDSHRLSDAQADHLLAAYLGQIRASLRLAPARAEAA